MKKYSKSQYDIIDMSKQTNQTWKGKNKFLLSNKIYVGPQFYFGFLTFLYLILYSLLFVFFVTLVRQLLHLCKAYRHKSFSLTPLHHRNNPPSNHINLRVNLHADRSRSSPNKLPDAQRLKVRSSVF